MTSTNAARPSILERFSEKLSRSEKQALQRATTRKAAQQAAQSAGDRPRVFSSVNREKLAELLDCPDDLRATKATEPIPFPEKPLEAPSLSMRSLQAFTVLPGAAHRGKEALVEPRAAENAAIRSTAREGESWGREELWGVRSAEGADPRYLWATPSAIAAVYPDAYTQERRRQAGVTAAGKEAEMVARFGVFRAPLHG